MPRRIGALAAALLSAAVLAGCAGDGSDATAGPRPTAEDGIGGWPSFLPSPAAAGAARGSVADPAMSFAGSPVRVALSGHEVVVDVQGPSYPADTPLGADAVRCTFTVRVTADGAAVDLSRARFDVLDHLGRVHRLRPAPGSTPPGVVADGRSATVRLVATVPSGEGLVRYAPAGSSTSAAWDYVAETD